MLCSLGKFWVFSRMSTILIWMAASMVALGLSMGSYLSTSALQIYMFNIIYLISNQMDMKYAYKWSSWTAVFLFTLSSMNQTFIPLLTYVRIWSCLHNNNISALNLLDESLYIEKIQCNQWQCSAGTTSVLEIALNRSSRIGTWFAS